MERETNGFELKYTSSDTLKLIEHFCALYEYRDDVDKLKTELYELTKYPSPVITEFLKCISLIKDDEKDIKENYMGILGYITMRLNLCTLKN